MGGIRRLYRAEGLSRAAIARRLSLSRNTVAKALGADAPPRYERASSATSAWAQVEPAAGTHLKVDVGSPIWVPTTRHSGPGRSPDCLPSVPPQPWRRRQTHRPGPRILQAPRIAEHYHRLAEQGPTQAGHWRTTSVPYSPWNQCPRRIQCPPAHPPRQGSRRSKRVGDFDFTAQPSIDPRPDRPIQKPVAGSPKPVIPCCSARPGPAKHIWPPHWVSPQPSTGHRRRIRPGHRMDHRARRHTAPTDSMPNYARSPATDSS